MLSLEEIQKKLEDRRLYVVAEATGLSYPTIKRFADGKAEKCEIETLEKISEYLTK